MCFIVTFCRKLLNAEISLLFCTLPTFKNFLNKRKFERRSKRFERERDRKVLKKLSAGAIFLVERERERSRIF